MVGGRYAKAKRSCFAFSKRLAHNHGLQCTPSVNHDGSETMLEYMVRIMVVILTSPFIFSTVRADVNVLVIPKKR